MGTEQPQFLRREDFDLLLEQLRSAGYRLHGPQVRDDALVYDELHSSDSLPKGWTDLQEAGSYQLQQTGSERLFDWANGPQALKPLLFPSRETLWQARRKADGTVEFIIPEHQVEKVAVIGVKACDLAALQLQDRHFLGGEYSDPGYQARRTGLFLVAVNCSHAAATCFCHSTGDGPNIKSGYDLSLTELDQGFLINADSASGRNILQALPLRQAQKAELKEAKAQLQQTIAQQQRAMPAIKLHQLQQQRDHPQWDDIAERCLSCGNCTLVCPTCFCHHQNESLSLQGDTSLHQREWDSCFGENHGHLAGFQVRPDVKRRYQQWMIHKLDVWQEQYGRSGCVGCGRCTSWCPAEIDFVAEARKLSGDKS